MPTISRRDASAGLGVRARTRSSARGSRSTMSGDAGSLGRAARYGRGRRDVARSTPLARLLFKRKRPTEAHASDDETARVR